MPYTRIRVDDTRKQQREARAENKARELRQKQSELMRLKNLKKQEVCVGVCDTVLCMYVMWLYIAYS